MAPGQEIRARHPKEWMSKSSLTFDLDMAGSYSMSSWPIERV
jgi:hypothetical protein